MARKTFFIALVAVSSTACVGANPVWTEGEHGLWRLAFADGTALSAADIATNGVAGTCRVSRAGAVTRREWKTDWADVTVTETATGEGAVDYRATVTPRGGRTAKMLDLPATLRFAPKDVESFVYPGRGNSGIGMAFNEKFFLPSPPGRPTSWHVGKCSGPKGYLRMYGDYLACLPLDWPKTNLTVTAEGKEWLGVDAPNRFKTWQRFVLRPPKKGKSDLVLVDSPNGPFFSANRFGGTGALWRFGCAGGGGHDWVPPCESFILRRLLPKLAQAAPTRTRVALLSMRCGPKSGGFVHLGVKEWRTMLTKFLPAGCTYEDVQDVVALRRLLVAKDVLLVVNPYGEYFPVERAEDLMARLDDVKSFVKGGGNWMEVGGYSFYHPLVGGGYHSIREPYPPLFSDFAHMTTKDGRTAAVYGVRPRKPHEPWKNPTPFTPGETALGGDERGGWYVHSFACWAKEGASFTTPVVRVRTEASLEASLADYALANDLTRPLNDKVKDAAKLDLFKRAPLFFLGGTARQKIAALDKIPVPSLLHYSDYLKGGFDKEYPDHLPPRPSFGTEAELREFHDRAHAKGHLVSPYTNPTWWCDHPRGPSFVAAGEAPLSLDFDGKPYHERYAKNDGWTITFWHPDVQKANRKTVREFTVDYPVDLLFQDQCGARAWRWDFNPASPSPLAYAEGILAMNEEDSRIVPLGTEDGWDQVANQQTAVCGCTWRIVPVRRPVWRDLFKDVYPADSWCIEPVATRLFHDKALFYMHDLGSFVMDERTLAWMFAIGYQLSWRAAADGYLGSAQQRDWYEWLQLLQDKVVSRIAGQPVKAFRHDRAPLLALPGDWSREEDDGVVMAQYGDVKVLANLGDVPRVVEGRRLAAYGWWISAPGLEAAKLEGLDPFVACGGRRWEYRTKPVSGVVGRKLEPPTCPYAAMVSPNTRLAVLDLGPGVGLSWTKASPASWVQALEASPLATKHGLKVTRIASAAELKAALAKGRGTYFAIVNPYGETFPVEGADRWKDMLDAVRAYVVQGGIWVETGSATFFGAVHNDQGKWRRTPLGTRGVEYIGAAVEMDDIDEPPVPLRANAMAKKWFSPELLKQIASTSTQVNRGVGSSACAPAFPLIEDGAGRVWFGCHRLGGWGCFWRIGGSNPDPALARTAVSAALLYQFTHVPEPMPPSPFRKVVESGVTRLEPVAGDATASVQDAVNAAWQAGGGTVKLAKGVWNVKCLRLRSHTTLHLESGAVLQASRNPDDSFILDNDTLEPVPAAWLSRARWDITHSCSTNLFTTQPGSRWNNGFIRILNATDVALVGEPGSVVDGMNPYDPDGEEYYRGVHGVSAINSHRLVFRGYTIRNTGNWAHRIGDCSDVVCENLTILAGHDGVHITGCDRVRIADCTMKTGDDCVAGFDNQGVTVTGCLLNTACSGMRFGGTDVLVEKCVFRGPAEYGFRGSLTKEEKIAGVASKAPSARRNMLSVFTYYADGTHPVRIPGGKVVIRDCTAENTDRFLHYNYGNEKWQIGKPMVDIRFERMTAKGLKLPLCAHGDRDLPITVALVDCAFSFREPTPEFVRGAFIRALDFHNVTVEGVKGPLLRLWGDRDAEIKADNVKGVPAEKVRGEGRFRVGAI